VPRQPKASRQTGNIKTGNQAGYQILRIIMTRYFFHVSNCHTFTDEAGKDPIGQQFSNPENAEAHATRIAREIAQDDDWDGYSVVVVDEHGNEIARVPIQN
jgi:uncharacterized protein DUF6894